MQNNKTTSLTTLLFQKYRPASLVFLLLGLSACTTPPTLGSKDCPVIAPADNQVQQCNINTGICSFGGEPGHYRVNIDYKQDAQASPQIYAESRRLIFDESIAGNDSKCQQFSINVRKREGQALQESAADGQAGLNLYIPEGSANISAISVSKIEQPRVLFIAGDSTVCDQDPQWERPANERFSGWGQILPAYFSSAISVTNYADSGEGTETFRTDGGALWQMMAEQIKPGDWMLIQLGHNDKKTPAALYRSRMESLVMAVKAKGAQPILVSPMIRNNGTPLDQQHIYGDLVVKNELQQLATRIDVPYIDLMTLSDKWARDLGKEQAQAYFVKKDQTHSNELGAKIFAQMIVEELRNIDSELTTYLRP